jgi:hypothetical protein
MLNFLILMLVVVIACLPAIWIAVAPPYIDGAINWSRRLW